MQPDQTAEDALDEAFKGMGDTIADALEALAARVEALEVRLAALEQPK